jgi:hypothetical protein
MGRFVPSRMNMKRASSTDDANESCFHAIFQAFLPSCDLADARCQSRRQWTVLFVTWYRITLLLDLLLQVPPLYFAPLQGKMERKESCFHVKSLLASCDLAVCVCQTSLAWTGLSITWYRITLLLDLLLQVPPLHFPHLHGKMERASRVFSTGFLLVKLRSFRCAMPVETAVDSRLDHMDRYHFATGLVAPSRISAKCPTIKGRANSHDSSCCFQFLLPSCDLLMYASDVETAETGFSIRMYHRLFVLDVLLQVASAPNIQPSKVERICHDSSCCFQFLLSSCDLWMCAMAGETLRTVLSIRLCRRRFVLDLLLQLLPRSFPQHVKMVQLQSKRAIIVMGVGLLDSFVQCASWSTFATAVWFVSHRLPHDDA